MDTKKPSDYELQWLRTGQQFERTDPITDTSKLVVGQDVWLSSVGHGFIEGKVVKVTPEGVDVQTTGQGMIHFNRNGYLPFGTIHDPAYWRIDSLPFAERRAMLERGRQKTMVVGQKVWMQSGDKFLKGTVEEVTEYYVRVIILDSGYHAYAYAIDFRYDGSQYGTWASRAGDWYPSPLCENSVPFRLLT
jgi:sRNA-binding protein